MPLFNLNSIGGTNYNVQNTETGDLITIKVIKAELLFEIMRAHQLQLEFLHKVKEATHLSITDLFEGFVQNPEDITWYSTVPNKAPNAETEAVKAAAKDGNSIAILEIITPNPWEGFSRPNRKKKD